MELGRVGVWSGALRNSDPQASADAAAELEALGYSTLWFPGGAREGLADLCAKMLGQTQRAVVATGIVSIWTHPADVIAAEHHALTQAYPGRFLLGVGVSHQGQVERLGQQYTGVYQKLVDYFDALDAAPTPVPHDERMLAALGPRMLRLAGARSAGTHPYFVPPAHTRIARDTLGPDALIATEQMVVMDADAATARALARPQIDRYLHAPNYTNNLLRLGYSTDDFENGGSDRLVDDIVAWGTPDTIMARVAEHHAAGADNVCIQVLTEPVADLQQALIGWRRLAEVGALR